MKANSESENLIAQTIEILEASKEQYDRLLDIYNKSVENSGKVIEMLLNSSVGIPQDVKDQIFENFCKGLK